MSTHREPSILRAETRARGPYSLYIGIADGMSVARVPARPYPRNGHAVGDADIDFFVRTGSHPFCGLKRARGVLIVQHLCSHGIYSYGHRLHGHGVYSYDLGSDGLHRDDPHMHLHVCGPVSTGTCLHT